MDVGNQNMNEEAMDVNPTHEPTNALSLELLKFHFDEQNEQNTKLEEKISTDFRKLEKRLRDKTSQEKVDLGYI